MQLPSKLQSGMNFKTSTVNAVNQIIDYLKTQRLVSDNKTIRLNQLTSGIAISTIQNPTAKGSGGEAFDHPFKLKIVTDENGKQKLNILQGRISISGDQGTRFYFGYEKGNTQALPQYLDLPTEQGRYAVVGYLCYDQPQQSDLNNLTWRGGCVYLSYEATTAEFAYTSGVCYFIIGDVEVTKNEDNSLSYTIPRQLITSSFQISDGGILKEFRTHFKKNSYPKDGTVIENFLVDKIIINGGSLFVDDQYYSISQFEETIEEQENFYCLSYNHSTKTANIQKVDINEWMFFDQETSIYLLPIALVYSSGVSGVMVCQLLEDSIYLMISGKVLLSAEDGTPSQFLSDKITYAVKQKQSLSEDEKQQYSGTSYIIGIRQDLNQESQTQGKSINLQDTLYWDYFSISGYDKEKQLKLKAEKGSLKWVEDQDSSNVEHTVKGSIQPFFEFEQQEQEDKKDGESRAIQNPQQQEKKKKVVLKYKRQADSQQIGVTPMGVSFLIDRDCKFQALTFDEEAEGEGVLSWNYSDKTPFVFVPPSAEQQQEENKKYVLTGTKGKSLQWLPFQASAISLQGSIENVFEVTVSEEQEKQGLPVLRVKTEYDQSVQQFHFLTLDSLGALQITTYEGQGQNSLYVWNNNLKQPQLINCLQPLEDSIYVLSGDLENGISWVNLDDYSGKVKCTAEDTADYLSVKVVPFIDESIIIQMDDADGYQSMMFGVNPQWFISSDESVIITYTDDFYLDITGAGMVQVTEDDVPQFLVDKIVSSLQHLTIDVDADELGQFLDININPSAFISSDESIIIEETEDGYIDFYGAGMVQVTEDDQPGFLIDKIGSSLQHLTVDVDTDNYGMYVDLNINPSAFISSDGSVIIQEAEDGSIDFYGAGMVQVNQADSPSYLADKIVSTDETIVVSDIGDAVDLSLNTDLFYSSDESIVIEDTEDGIDFRSVGKVKCTQADEADYLNSKIEVDESISSLITLEKQETQILIKSALQGSGLLAVQNGIITPIEAPTSGKYLLACNDGVLSWMEYSDCENACKDGDQQQ